MTTQKELRAAFWMYHPGLTRRGRTKQNDYPATVRVTWCDFIECMRRNGEITDALATRATL
jgi:hypothetical protein